MLGIYTPVSKLFTVQACITTGLWGLKYNEGEVLNTIHSLQMQPVSVYTTKNRLFI